MIIKTINIKIGDNKTQIKTTYYPNTSKKLLIFIGGSGNTKDDFKNIAENVIEKNIPYSLLLFSFCGYESKEFFPLAQQVKELEKVVNYAIEKLKYKKVSLFTTSMGAYSTCFLLSNKKFDLFIQEVLFLDPCDYDRNKAD